MRGKLSRRDCATNHCSERSQGKPVKVVVLLILTYGSLANASSVGANTVNGPAPFSAGTRPAAVSAAARVLNDPAPTAVSTMSAMLIDILLARTGARVETKAFATTRVDRTRMVCIILLFVYDNDCFAQVLDFKQYQLLQPFCQHDTRQ
jgi:hypothetical protein